MQAGFVSLVGAGPGDPDHLTLKGLRRLQEADLVLHDALVSEAVCELAVKAFRINVGKRAGRDQTPQHDIERLLIEGARQGLRVVRLKGGDPFVFGRGGEEALALRRAGIEFEIVPGLSSAIAAPALAGIPVTHRGVSPGFIVLNGTDTHALAAALGAIVPRSLTVVVLMGVGARERIANVLVSAGWDGTTPAALILGAATPETWTWRGTLQELAQMPLPHTSAPGTIVIGDVVTLPISVTTVKGIEHASA
jgi:uroporphyrin-III C-methyltransferase/precorrin-2 dehydrogenase/sirohydrochlorin ferrochelatase